MNFLAHLHLAEPTPISRMGNLLGDFVKGIPWDKRFPPELWQAIMEHRMVDSFTDQSAIWQESRQLLPDSLRRFAGIVIDIFYDYFLHRHWDRFNSSEVRDFMVEVHGHLEEAILLAPPPAAEVIRRMIREEWLCSYRTIEGVDATLRRVAGRSAAMAPVGGAAVYLDAYSADFEDHFLRYYPELIRHVDSIRPALAAKAEMLR